jgi:bifunctional non-homologous end joining protein LigD
MLMQRAVESVNLFFRAGSSDKVYAAAIEEAPGGYVVTFAYGRRGAALTHGQKTAAPVPLEKARAVFQKLVGEKTAKGYQPGGDIGVYVPAEQAAVVATGACQLLNPIEREEAGAFIANPAFATQLKLDGKRLQVGRKAGQMYALNRKGQPCAFPKVIADTLSRVPGGDFLIDGEQVGEMYHAFDLLELDGTDLRPKAFFDRYATLVGILMAHAGVSVRLVEAAFDTAAKQRMLSEAEAAGEEGVVFKRCDAPYTAGRPASGGDQFKCKFTESATCRVAAQNGEKRSVSLEILNESGIWASIGNVTVPANFATVPAPGSLVEVRYLYAFPGGSLFQPVLLGLRDDLSEEDCTIDQLKLKAEAIA